MIDFNTIYFCTKCIFTLACETVYYAFGRPRLLCVSNIAYMLSSENVMCTKILQAMSGSISFLKDEEVKFIYRFNDNVPYTMDELFDIHDIVDNLNNELSSDLSITGSSLPEKAGTIAVVYYAKLNEKDVVIKVKRKDVNRKYADGLKKMQAITL